MNNSPTTHTQLSESSLRPPIGKGREGKGREGKNVAAVIHHQVEAPKTGAADHLAGLSSPAMNDEDSR